MRPLGLGSYLLVCFLAYCGCVAVLIPVALALPPEARGWFNPTETALCATALIAGLVRTAREVARRIRR